MCRRSRSMRTEWPEHGLSSPSTCIRGVPITRLVGVNPVRIGGESVCEMD